MANVSVITVFVLSGFNETVNHRSIIFFLSLLCYCTILLANVSLIVIIILDNSLHEPMYILLCAFCMNGLYGTTGFYPKFLWDLLSPVHVISYSGCLVQALVMYSFVCSDLSILAVMAYDRYLAICRPLEYHSVMSKNTVTQLAFFSWFTPFCIIAGSIYLTSRVKLCSSHIDKLFCVNWSIVQLACFPEETAVNGIVGNITVIIYGFHGLFIVWSYLYLIKTCISSLENRAKFMQTCVPHLISLFTFIFTLFFDIIALRLASKDFPQMLLNFMLIEFLIIPPIMNPLIYGFKLTKIRNKISGVVYFQMNVKQHFMTSN
ncbi:olfactory receptor 2AT4-like [Acanthochromis polyacanthus]|uniref:olfactory receptor 2AT4-like n=1 Tax=Acanthochromis polyacanthus TaxID=80966 RepID=UPI002234E044|nr:olfactory receptor 2AT4-like [Acanthochromis polyacanthus]